MGPTRISFQSTHPSGVRHVPDAGVDGAGAISIHAPQWGATFPMQQCPSSGNDFNPRTPVGCDPTTSDRVARCCYFNPRTPVGCDTLPRAGSVPSINFNPRTPVGCDISSKRLELIPQDFNPRTPVGCDQRIAIKHIADAEISIHAPQWGATVRSENRLSACSISIHAPQWGATRKRILWRIRKCYFNPRTPVGCDRSQRCRFQCGYAFQSTHPSGVRLVHDAPTESLPPISIHAPQWGATEPFSTTY